RRVAPPNAGPAYINKIQVQRWTSWHDPDESVFSRLLHEEVFAPEKLPGNISIATGVSVFIGGILAVRTWG
ncbi:hypothetical protein BDZ89DRAFT_916518, partial [Hymenopellis radicata]